MPTTEERHKPPAPEDLETELYLVVPGDHSNTGCARNLMLALETLQISAVLLPARPCRDGIQTENLRALRDLVAVLQSKDIAVMVNEDPKLAREIGADGVHLDWRSSIIADYEAARGLGGGQMMIGAVAGKSRHDAMVLAEAGADYISFGVPGTVKDQQTARKRQLELIAWWAEMFEIPVVAFDITTIEQAATVKAAGADFVAATLPPNSTDQAQFEDWLAGFANLFPRIETKA